jgi:RNA 2',3'-cyclic 3'-phosphodiesterase
MSHTVRLFAALFPPAEARPGFADAQRAADRASPGSFRWVPLDSVHVTLAFLGERPFEEVGGLRSALATVAGPVLDLTTGGVVLFPSALRPRVVGVAVEEPTGALVALQAGLARALGVTAEEASRPFVPHATIGRLRPGRPVSPALARAKLASVEFRARSVCLVQSTLSPDGSTYAVLAEAPLG